jgi:FkbM family methyltransferase
MEVATYVYGKFLRSKGIQKKVWSLARKFLIKFLSDPTCTLPLHGRDLRLPLSHALPLYIHAFPNYDRLPTRISGYIRQRQGFLSCIDVGANIGDSIASFYQSDKDSFLAVEPNPKFGTFLISNWSWNENIVPMAVVCTSNSGIGNFELTEKNGTTSLRQAEHGRSIVRQSLDDLVMQNPAFQKANVIKIDTDGHDFDVISGGKKLISRNRPVVLFECDAFRNTNYVEDCLSSLQFFADNEYEQMLLYDNLGNFLGKHSLSDLQPFKNLLFYQLTGNRCYFDILIMQEEDLLPFFRLEIDYFASTTTNKSMERTARDAMLSS